MNNRFLYVFLDESGNLDFTPKGTKYFLIGSITKERPFEACKEMMELKYDLAEDGDPVEYFHAAEDVQTTRNAVFRIIKKHLAGVHVDTLIVDKRKTSPGLQQEMRFYPEMLGNLLRHILSRVQLEPFKEVIVFTDRVPINRKKEALEKAIKRTLSVTLPAGTRYRIVHHDSKSNFDLQIADYCNWAVYRKWERGDQRHYDLIAPAVRSERDIFQADSRYYY